MFKSTKSTQHSLLNKLDVSVAERPTREACRSFYFLFLWYNLTQKEKEHVQNLNLALGHT